MRSRGWGGGGGGGEGVVGVAAFPKRPIRSAAMAANEPKNVSVVPDHVPRDAQAPRVAHLWRARSLAGASPLFACSLPVCAVKFGARRRCE